MPVSPVGRGLGRCLGPEEALGSCGGGTQRKARSPGSCLVHVDFSPLDKGTFSGAGGSFPGAGGIQRFTRMHLAPSHVGSAGPTDEQLLVNRPRSPGLGARPGQGPTGASAGTMPGVVGKGRAPVANLSYPVPLPASSHVCLSGNQLT